VRRKATATAGRPATQRRAGNAPCPPCADSAAGWCDASTFHLAPHQARPPASAIPRLPLLQHAPDTGDTRADLAALLASLVATSEAIGTSLTGVVLAEQHEQPELLVHWRATVRVAALHVVNDIVETGLGAYIAHYTHQGDPDRGWVDAIVDTLWQGLAPVRAEHPQLERLARRSPLERSKASDQHIERVGPQARPPLADPIRLAYWCGSAR
jgi:hypothetical protein